MSLQLPMAHRPKDQGATKAVILVGGPSRGTRFRPLSLDLPKPLFEVAGHPIIWHCLSSIARVPNKLIQEVYIIGYYDESVFRDFIKDSAKEFPSITIRYLREYQALGTAGGLYHFRDAILKGRPERLFVLNADVCCSFPLAEMLKLFIERDAEAVILGTRVSDDAATNFGCIVSDAHTRRVLHYVEKPESHISNLINCGVYLFSTEAIFPSIKSAIKRRLDRPARLFSYPSSENLDSYNIPATRGGGDDEDDEGRKNEVIRLEQDILGDMADSKQFYVYETKDFWRQIKTAGSAVPANALYLQKAWQTSSAELAQPSANIVPPVFIHPTAHVHPTAKLGPNVSIGPRATIGAGARVKESVVLEDCDIKHDACVLYSIIGWGSRVGAWARVEGTPTPVGSHSTTIIKNGVKVQSITILGKDCGVGDEVRVQNCVCLPYKELKRDVANEVIM
ncbi:mannose-1-phosphate guanyltransferase [Tolypocladium capitatum]|uniref:Mannose-1-phosphate guanyltransferase n=1 Tax=Tolypocladium capitatum TaxID=45235 RepID=A0A2K3PXE0_9HYPO|nr:mannose-1-phosphate guanyltransferase [Tolypocladium capitatum]